MNEYRSIIGSGTARRTVFGNAPQRKKINDRLTWALVIMVLLAPLPLGSARAIAWGLWAVVLGVIAAIYGFKLLRSRHRLTAGISSAGPAGLLLALSGVWLAVQILPLGIMVGPFPIATGSGVVGSLNTISIDPSSTILMMLRQATYGLLFFLFMQAAARPWRRNLIANLLLGGCVGYALLGLFALHTGDWILGADKWAYLGSATGPFVNRNSFATFLAFGCVIATARIAARLSDRLARAEQAEPFFVSGLLINSIALVMLLAVVAATQSRMGLVAALAGAGMTIAATALRSTRLLPVTAIGLLGTFAAMLVAIALFGEGLMDRFASVEQSALVRAALYEQVLELIGLRPWTGFGGGTFELAFPLVHQPPVNSDLVWDRAHSTYLALWAEMGLIAGSLPLIAVGLLAWRMITAPEDAEVDWVFRAMGLGAIAVAAIHSLTDFSLEIQANALLFVCLLAVGLPQGRSDLEKGA
jgi:O-antigen ligase